MLHLNTSGKAGKNLLLCFVLAGITSCSDNEPASVATEAGGTSSSPTAAEIHESSLVLDAHADIVIPSTSRAYMSADGTSKVDPAKMRAGGVDAVVMSVAVGPGPRTAEGDAAARAEADEKIAAVHALVEESQGLVVIATTSSEIVEAHEAGKSALILGFQNARSLQKNVSAIDEFYAEGVRIFGLNHLGHNAFSDSSRPEFSGETGAFEVTEEHGGLSSLGVAAVERINALGALVDVSQLSKAATLQVLELTNSPIIASHSNAKTVSDVTRNLSDEEIDRIGENGGVIHVAAFKGYLINISEPEFIEKLVALRVAAGISIEYNYPFELYWEIDDLAERSAFTTAVSELLGPASTDNMIEHIDYIVDRIGIDHVGIGNDFNHGSGIDDYNDASEAANLTAGLLSRGYSESDINKIWSGNFLRILDAAAQNKKAALETSALFIGNSFTYGYGSAARFYRADSVTDLNNEGIGGVPALFKSFTDQAGLDYDVYLETRGGSGLDFHLESKLDVIGQRPWDQVVMHGYSTLDSNNAGNPSVLIDTTAQMASFLEDLNPAVEVFLTATWSRADRVYKSDGPWRDKPIAQMALDVRAGYDKAAAGAATVKAVNGVGEAWSRAMEAGIADPNPYDGIDVDKIDLWTFDHYHASTYGYYLEALVVFGNLTGLDPRSLGDNECSGYELGISRSQVEGLQQVAYEQLASEGRVMPALAVSAEPGALEHCMAAH